jgi:hypothetical protein
LIATSVALDLPSRFPFQFIYYAMAESKLRIYGNLGTLYSQCGGVFGVAAFVDRCMDKWMNDATLNANQAVATWHEKAQRCGCKFLVVQIVCNLTGGPQRYTGRPLDIAHKHLNIDDDQWCKFMEIFNEVCDEFGLPGEVVDDLNALMISMEEDCVVHPGERVPRNPGPARPSGGSIYARLGGVYPIALFVDRLIDALLGDERVRIPCDAQKRNEVSLKYLFTELICHVTGGPEVVTCKESEETKLLVPKAAWPIFLATAEAAADHLPTAVRPSLMQVLQRSKDLIIDSSSGDSEVLPATVAQVKSFADAAAGKMLSKEVIAARHAAPGAHVAARRRVHGDPRTLYGRGGGIFGLSRLADRLMDVWMEDPALNANAMVARWHESRQKYGFKFLVTQIMGYLTGGPQRYTGRPMDVAHKHLNITSQQWDSFMAGAERVFGEFAIDPRTSLELRGILSNFQTQCVVQPGEVVPPDPGASKPGKATSGTLYHNLGGVYPIAQFADRLVETVLRGDAGVHVEWHRVDDANGSRHPPGLKYMVTELVCNYTGGPEIVTSKGFDDAKLGVSVDEWPAFLALAAKAAEVWPSVYLRNALMSAIAQMKAELCIGLVAEDVPESAGTRAIKRIEEAGFGHFEATAALEKSGGDAEKAVELLASGWSPQADPPTTSNSSASRCPFLAGNTKVTCPNTMTMPAGHPSVQRAKAPRTMTTPPSAQHAKAPPSAAATTDDPMLTAARVLSGKGMPVSQIAELLSICETKVAAALAQDGSGAIAGRVLGSSLQVKLDDLLIEDSELCCPIALVLFSDPVIASDGFMYERASVEALFRNPTKHGVVSPMTREKLKKDFLPAKQKKKESLEFREKRAAELLQFVKEAATGQPTMAITALERVNEYIPVLKPGANSALVQTAARFWREVGREVPAELGGA